MSTSTPRKDSASLLGLPKVDWVGHDGVTESVSSPDTELVKGDDAVATKKGNNDSALVKKREETHPRFSSGATAGM